MRHRGFGVLHSCLLEGVQRLLLIEVPLLQQALETNQSSGIRCTSLEFTEHCEQALPAGQHAYQIEQLPGQAAGRDDRVREARQVTVRCNAQRALRSLAGKRVG